MNITSVTSRSHLLLSAAACVSSLLLADCGTSVPTHYYTLLDETHEPTPILSPRFLIDLQPVDIPAQADQPKLVVRSGDGSMTFLEHERWIAPLPDELHGNLSVSLANKLHTTDVAGLSTAGTLPVIRIKVDFRRFESEVGRYALIDATWALSLKDSPRQTLVCSTQVRASVGNDYTGLARGYRDALTTLSSQIASTTEQYERNQKTTCSSAPTTHQGISGSP